MIEYVPIPADPELVVSVYYDGTQRGVTPSGRPWSYWCLDGDGPDFWQRTYWQGRYRLGDLRLCKK